MGFNLNIKYVSRLTYAILLVFGIGSITTFLYLKHDLIFRVHMAQLSNTQKDIQQILDEKIENEQQYSKTNYTLTQPDHHATSNTSDISQNFKNVFDDSNAYDQDRRKASQLRIANQVITDYRPDLAKRFQEIVDRKLPADDKLLIDLILDMMDWPSDHIPKNSMKVVHTPQSKYIAQQIFNKKKAGFFVECGALDGERSSNTIWLEQYLQWTGLLIEADPYFYTQLLGKNRRSWSINACLSPTKYADWLTFAEHSYGEGSIVPVPAQKEKKATRRVPCFPLEALLLSLNRTKVDFFSLDVEGLEMKILRAIPHDRLNIKAWTIEFDKVGEENVDIFMKEVGYTRKTKIVEVDRKIHLYARDLVFVKEDS